MLEMKVEAFLERHSFKLENQRIVVGVSGGADSLALLHLLMEMKEKRNLFIVVAHVDHMLRGEESFEDAMFVKEFCAAYTIPFEMAKVDVQDLMIRTGKSVETAAREARYDFFEKVMKEFQCSYLALAHHGDDQIETVLMRLTRGSTGKARAGIPFQRPFGPGSIFRPFLNVTKEEINRYCEEKDLVPRFDPSNQEIVYTRNRFRKFCLPFLKEENPQVHEHFQRFSEELRSDEDLLQELTVEKMNKVMTARENEHISIDRKRFLEMPLPLQRRGIQLILNYLYNERPGSLSAVHIDQVLALIKQSHPSGKLDFPNGLKVIRSYHSCHFQFAVFSAEPYFIEIGKQGTYHVPGFGKITLEYKDAAVVQSSDHTALFHMDQIELPIIIRTRKNGDRMTLKGRTGTKKLKDIFIDRKVPIQERDIWPVIFDHHGRIIWLPGLKKSALEGVDKSAGRVIQLTYSRNDIF